MTMRRSVFVLLLAVPLAAGAPVPKEIRRPDDLSRMAGDWREVPADGAVRKGTNYRFTFDKDGRAAIHEADGRASYRYTFALDPQTAPPSLTWSSSGGGPNYRGAYRLDGDTLAFVFVPNDQPFPKEVKPGLGTYYELRREK